MTQRDVLIDQLVSSKKIIGSPVAGEVCHHAHGRGGRGCVRAWALGRADAGRGLHAGGRGAGGDRDAGAAAAAAAVAGGGLLRSYVQQLGRRPSSKEVEGM